MLSEITQNGNWTFLKNMFCFHFAQFFGNVVFLKNLLFPYIFQNTSSPESCPAVLLFCNCVWKSWKKIPVKEFIFKHRTCSYTKKCTLSFLIFQTFWLQLPKKYFGKHFLVAIFGKIVTGKGFGIKSHVKCWLPNFFWYAQSIK